MSNQRNIKLNSDVGEGLENEETLLPYLSSCSVACGGHAGDVDTMKHIVRLAKLFDVKVGAHPSYPDRANFGRKKVSITTNLLARSIKEQINNLKIILEEEQMVLHHIKAHGALYNNMVKDKSLAKLFLQAIPSYKKTSYLYVPYGSVIATEALTAGFTIQYEAFGDRNYNKDLSLVSRNLPNALIEKPKEVMEHITRMYQDHNVRTIEGNFVKILADTYCIHGDTPTALEILTYLSERFPKK